MKDPLKSVVFFGGGVGGGEKIGSWKHKNMRI